MNGSNSGPYFRDVKVNIDLAGPDGGTHYILRKVIRAMRKAEIPQHHIDHFRRDVAACHDYNSILAIIGRWICFNDNEYAGCGKWIDMREIKVRR